MATCLSVDRTPLVAQEAPEAGLSAWPVTSPCPPQDTEQAGVLADDTGAIAGLLLHYNEELADEVAPVFRDLFRHLPGRIDITVVCSSNETAEAFVEQWGAPASANGREVVVIDAGRPVSVWARDRHIARHDLSTYLPETAFVPVESPIYDESKLNDLDVLQSLSRFGLLPSVMVETLHLEGGNLVANRCHAFVGINVLEENESTLEDVVLQTLEEIAGRSVVLLHDDLETVPWCHADMYLTPVADRTVLVASTHDGLSILDTVVEQVLIDEEEDGCDAFLSVIDRSPRIDRSLDDITGQLENAGYRVVRTPAIAASDDEWMVTYNNVLMDERHGRRTVFMPVYDLPELDERARMIYRSLGFEVRDVDVSEIFRLGGTLRCLVNVTERAITADTNDEFNEADRAGRIQRCRLDDLLIDVDDEPVRLALGRALRAGAVRVR